MRMFVGYRNDIWEVLAFYKQEYLHDRFVKLWLCRCFCGKEVIRKSQQISSGIAKSCGCFIQSRPGNKSKHDYHTTHGFSKGIRHPLYVNWLGMKQRCCNPKHKAYRYYGGKGITVCDEWNNNFVSFMTWCLLNNWKHGLTVDRIDTSKGYNPDNCRLVTKSENTRLRNVNSCPS